MYRITQRNFTKMKCIVGTRGRDVRLGEMNSLHLLRVESEQDESHRVFPSGGGSFKVRGTN